MASNQRMTGEGLPGIEERRRYTAFYECGEEMRRPRPSDEDDAKGGTANNARMLLQRKTYKDSWIDTTPSLQPLSAYSSPDGAEQAQLATRLRGRFDL